MKKTIAYFLFIAVLGFSCTKDCCYDGTSISQEEADDIINDNESNDSLLNAFVNGDFRCLNDQVSTGIQISIRDSQTYETIIESDPMGIFKIRNLPAGIYTLKFSKTNLPSYTNDEWNLIIARVNEIILGGDNATNIEKLAFNLINYDDGISTFDRVIFERLRDGETTIDEIEFPWRFVMRDMLDQTQIISDSLVVKIETAEALNFQITPIFIGDSEGKFCN